LSFERWLEPVVGAVAASHAAVMSHALLAVVSTVVAVLGMLTAWILERERKLETSGLPGSLVRVFSAKYWVDEGYAAVFQTGGKRLGGWLWLVFDAVVVDGAVNGLARVVSDIGGYLRRWNNGYVRSYAFSVLAGAVIIVGYLILHAATQAGTPPPQVPLARLLGKGTF
jgi:NADH-quinone oxidoreductase subunit L